MSVCRKSDIGTQSHFRSNRFIEEEGKWFFYTREGTLEGPYGSKAGAVSRLDNYIRIVESGLLPEQPLDMGDT